MAKQLADALRKSGITPEIFKSEDSSGTTETRFKSLEEYYYQKYGRPTSDLEAQKILRQVYQDIIGPVTSEVQSGIAEYYHLLKERGFPAFYWIVSAFNVVSKKDKQKRNFPYIVGMLRHWLLYGYGHIPTQEETEVVEFFEKITGQECSLEARKILQHLMGTYGVIKMTIEIPELKKCDLSLFYAQALREKMDVKYSGG